MWNQRVESSRILLEIKTPSTINIKWRDEFSINVKSVGKDNLQLKASFLYLYNTSIIITKGLYYALFASFLKIYPFRFPTNKKCGFTIYESQGCIFILYWFSTGLLFRVRSVMTRLFDFMWFPRFFLSRLFAGRNHME